MKKPILLLLAACLCLSCSASGDAEQEPSRRTVLIYMAADNNLHKSAQRNIDDMLKAENPDECNLLVYLDIPYESPSLLKIQKERIDTVKLYKTQNSASKQVLKTVINESFSLFPAESYGLVLWSHGTGWLPGGVFDDVKTRSFGKDNGEEMEIEDLAEALPENLDFIVFDACLMSGIEVLYQLRNKADIIIASPTEVLVAGFPYEKIIPLLLMPSPNYGEIAFAYMEHYKSRNGDLQSASIAVIDARQLKPLADLVHEAIKQETDLACPSKELLQRYDSREPALFFDLENYLEHAISSESNLTALKKQIAKTVIYRDFTPYFLDEFAIEKSSGIGIYIPFESDILFNYYSLLDWHKDSGLYCI